MSEGALTPEELDIMGYSKVYDYTQYSHDHHVNVIPENEFKRLVEDTFKTITYVLRGTYGPYGSTVVISDQNETTTTKDGFNVFQAIGFSHQYKRMVYLAIKKIIERVNRNVGDGTTSCILLAEKLFHKISEIAITSDEKRHVLKALTIIEDTLQHRDDEESSDIEPLTEKSFMNVISLAGNYDDELTDILTKAMDPQISDDEKRRIESVRNVIVESEVDTSMDSSINYSIDHLPGDYRVRVNMDVEFGLSFNVPTPIKVVIYDHTFGSTDWLNFYNGYDKESKILVIARSFSKGFMDNEYVRYLRERALVKQPINIVLCEIKGDFVQNEIKDLAALLKTDVRTLNSAAVDHSLLPTATIQVHNGNCLCFHNVEPPLVYINKLSIEMQKDLSKSFIKRNNYLDRIRALSLKSKDTLITVKAASSLELKMICDKIDDCTSIIQSAMNNGVVPNMLRYAYLKAMELHTMKFDEIGDEASMISKIADAIMESIRGLFWDIYDSKYPSGTYDSKVPSDIIRRFYEEEFCSYDIINEKFVDTEELPTSAQYDIEVVAAAISIVKYLLTSKSLIFDAHLMRPTDDVGHYERF